MQTAIVDGIERFACLGYHHPVIQCDNCKTTYDGGNGSTKEGPYRPVGYNGHEEELLKAHARSIGWTGPMTRTSCSDLCPECSKNQVSNVPK